MAHPLVRMGNIVVQVCYVFRSLEPRRQESCHCTTDRIGNRFTLEPSILSGAATLLRSSQPSQCREVHPIAHGFLFSSCTRGSTLATSWVRGIHLTGVYRHFCSPRAVCGRPGQTRRMPASTRRSGRDFPRPTGRDEVVVAHGDVGHREFENSVAHHPPAPRVPSAEAEHEAVETEASTSLVSSEAREPPLAGVRHSGIANRTEGLANGHVTIREPKPRAVSGWITSGLGAGQHEQVRQECLLQGVPARLGEEPGAGPRVLLHAAALLAGIGSSPLCDGAPVASAQLGESVDVAAFSTGAPSRAVWPCVASGLSTDLPRWALTHLRLIF